MAKCDCENQQGKNITTNKGDKFTKCTNCDGIISWGKWTADNTQGAPAKKQATANMDSVLVDLVRLCSQHAQLIQDVRALECTVKELQTKVSTRNFIDEKCKGAVTSP